MDAGKGIEFVETRAPSNPTINRAPRRRKRFDDAVVQRGREILPWLAEGAAFTINILDATQTDMIVHFGKGFALDQAAFEGLEIERSETGNPVLSEALAYLDCQVHGRCGAGDHELVLGRVTAGRVLGEGTPMVHVRKSGVHY